MSFMRLGSPTVPICVTDTSMEFTMGCVLVTRYFSPLLVFIIIGKLQVIHLIVAIMTGY